METTQNRNTLSINEMKALEKAEKGSDKSASAAPMNMVKPNKTRAENFPMTPPEEKRSVSFDLSNNVLEIPKEYYNNNNLNGFGTSPAESIDIAVHDLSQDILVAMVERDTEMKDLFIRNQVFFDTVKQSIFEDDEKWKEFLKVLYSKREEIPDSEWMNSISEFLSSNPPFLANFKQIIGYYEDDFNIQQQQQQQQDQAEYQDYDDFYTSDPSDVCMINNVGYTDITPIRNYPKILENLEKSYPQFFINAQNELGKEKQRRNTTILGSNHLCNDNPILQLNGISENNVDNNETLYDEFKRILVSPRDVMDDVEWETAIYECLDPWPQLVAQFEEIITYELGQ